MKILLTGIHGQVGSALFPLLPSSCTVLAPPRSVLDLSDLSAVEAWLQRERPDMVINAAAYTAVDKAEQETTLAYRLNAELPACLAHGLEGWQGVLIHYSSDYVFDGSRPDGGYRETDETHPLGVYGQSKQQGEGALLNSPTPALIFRTSWVYSLHGRNFLKTMLKLGPEREELRVVNDQWGAPTWAGSIAHATKQVLSHFLSDNNPNLAEQVRPYHGLYHLTNGGATTWYDFTARIFALRPECRARLIPIPSQEYPSPVPRPANSRLDNHKLQQTFGVSLPDWSVALSQCLAALPPQST